MILVTGATGNVGGALLTRLTAEGRPVRALVRSAERGDTLRGYDAEIVEGTYEDPASLRACLRGVEGVFVVCAAGPGMADLEIGVLDVVRQEAPDARVVVLAAAGVDADGDSPVRLTREHQRVRRHLLEHAPAATVVAPGSFQQNLLRYAGAVQEQGVLPASVGSARISHVDVRDVAAVAAHALTTEGHEGATYTVTGPEAVTYAQVAATLSEVLGREVRHVDLPPDQARAGAVAAGLPEWLADGLAELNDAYRDGAGEVVTDEVQKATGRPARSVEQFVREHASAFR